MAICIDPKGVPVSQTFEAGDAPNDYASEGDVIKMISTTKRPIRLVIADPSNDSRSSLIARLANQPSIQLVGEAPRVDQAIESIANLQPNVALVAREFWGPDTPKLVKRIVGGLGVGSVAHSTHLTVVSGPTPLGSVLEMEEVRRTISAGARSYLMRDRVEINLVRGLHHMADGWSVYDPRLSMELAQDGTRLHAHVHGGSPSNERLAQLSAREQQVALMIGRGMSNREIADELGLTIYTVKSHVGGVLRKLDLRDRLQIANALQ